MIIVFVKTTNPYKINNNINQIKGKDFNRISNIICKQYLIKFLRVTTKIDTFADYLTCNQQQYQKYLCNVIRYLVAQIINVYSQQYESAAAFWPQVHSRIIASLLISQLLLLGLLSTKKAANSTPLLVILPVLTLAFHKYSKNRFEPAFRKYPLEVSFSLSILYSVWMCFKMESIIMS